MIFMQELCAPSTFVKHDRVSKRVGYAKDELGDLCVIKGYNDSSSCPITQATVAKVQSCHVVLLQQ